jgi:hypothetical protein
MKKESPSPEHWTLTKKVLRVNTNELDKNKFLSTEDGRIDFWNVEYTKTPQLTFKGSNLPILATDWSMHDENQGLIIYNNKKSNIWRSFKNIKIN